ncbi:MAG TPA: hypothetical protein VGI15_06840 [Candidatus Cybelea sp.]
MSDRLSNEYDHDTSQKEEAGRPDESKPDLKTFDRPHPERVPANEGGTEDDA